jgi:YQGE family putative transporter
MFSKLREELTFFRSQPLGMRMLLLTNLIYGLVVPIIELFIGAYIMRNSSDLSLVVIFQLALYTGIPITFGINGWLLNHMPIARLYSVRNAAERHFHDCHDVAPGTRHSGVFVAGLIMGLSYGFFWANRDFLALNTTNDNNRNYYYGIETFFYTTTGIVVPLMAGAFIATTEQGAWFEGNVNAAYYTLTATVFTLAIFASMLVHRGEFKNPRKAPFVFFSSTNCGTRCWDWRL